MLNFTSIYGEGKGDFSLIESVTGSKHEGIKWIGIAPFAKHEGKIYPLELQEQVVAHFANRQEGQKSRLFLMPGGRNIPR